MTGDLEHIVIAGGGAAGWMAALAFVTMLPPRVRITLVESEAIGIIGVGESTTPLIRDFNRMVGIDEPDFARHTEATFKLGIEFVDWGLEGKPYFHGFGVHGQPMDGVTPYDLWRRSRALGDPEPLHTLCMATALAAENRFQPPSADRTVPGGEYDYAFHFDATLYARYLRERATAKGVERIEGRIVEVPLDPENGFIRRLVLADGRAIDGDFFVDCTGFRALLIDGALGSRLEDWSDLLPVDRAWAVPTQGVMPLTPFTRTTARAAGWQWRIPLQHRTGNGHVFASAFTSEQEALDTLLANLDGACLKDPTLIRFTSGFRRRAWVKNCLSLGLAGGFLEPLESTAILLVQTAIIRFLDLQPDTACAPALAEEFNRQSAIQYENIRDFLLLHYVLTRKPDEPFWAYMDSLALPESLVDRIAMFTARGRILYRANEGFFPPSWTYILAGSGLVARDYPPLLDTVPPDRVRAALDHRRRTIRQAAGAVPTAADFVRRFCQVPAAPLSGARPA